MTTEQAFAEKIKKEAEQRYPYFDDDLRDMPVTKERHKNNIDKIRSAYICGRTQSLQEMEKVAQWLVDRLQVEATGLQVTSYKNSAGYNDCIWDLKLIIKDELQQFLLNYKH